MSFRTVIHADDNPAEFHARHIQRNKDLTTLISMGFGEPECLAALVGAGYNKNLAIQYLQYNMPLPRDKTNHLTEPSFKFARNELDKLIAKTAEALLVSDKSKLESENAKHLLQIAQQSADKSQVESENAKHLLQIAQLIFDEKLTTAIDNKKIANDLYHTRTIDSRRVSEIQKRDRLKEIETKRQIATKTYEAQMAAFSKEEEQVKKWPF
jgi:hypothetical protein